MEWVGISGSWRYSSAELERDVRLSAAKIFLEGKGLVTGGALGVDYLATDEMLKLDMHGWRLKIILPTPFDVYAKHYFQRASEGVITLRQADMLVSQLREVKKRNSRVLLEMGYDACNEESYHARNTLMLELAGRLEAFQVNGSKGVQDAIDKAHQQGMPVNCKHYEVAA